jgi:heme-binding protein
MSNRKIVTFSIAVALVLLLAQLVPYGREHTNPPEGTLASFDSPVTKDLAQRACFDCHSNRTRWPWYASVAPISWRIHHHVAEGREKLNFSAFDPAIEKVADAAGEAGQSVTRREMPPVDYLVMHPEARLTLEERATLARGLDATFAAFVHEGDKAGGSEVGPKSDRD